MGHWVLRYERNGSGLALPKAGAYAQRGVVFGVDRLREHRLFLVELHHGFGHRYLQNKAVALWRVHRHFAHAGPQASPCCQHGGAAHAVAACHKQGVAHASLVGEVAALLQQGAHFVLVYYVVAGVCLCHAFLADAYVEHFQPADVVLVLCEKERQLGLLERQRQVGMYGVGPHVVGVVLGHQPRRHVDAHHAGRGSVDILYQRGETAGQRLVEPGAKQPVDHQGAGVEVGRVELLLHFNELLYFLDGNEPVLVCGAIGRQMPGDVE